MYVDEVYAEVIMGKYYVTEEVTKYVNKFSDKQLLLEAKEVLYELRSVPEVYATKVKGIITYGIVCQELTEKQRFALGAFICSNS